MGSSQSPKSKAEATAKQQAADRLAQALRDNLHRRKAQARARTDTQKTSASNPPQTDDTGQC